MGSPRKTPSRKPRPGVTGGWFDSVERLTRILIGIALVARAHSDDALARAAGDRVPVRRATRRRRGPRGIPQALPGAVVGLSLATQRAIFDRISAAEDRVGKACGLVGRVPVVAIALDPARGFLNKWEARYRAEAEMSAEIASDYLATIGPGTLDELLTRIDVDALFDHVDVNGAIARVDLEGLIDRVPMDRVVDAVDLRAVVLETVSQVQVTDIVREGTGAMAARLTGGRIRL